MRVNAREGGAVHGSTASVRAWALATVLITAACGPTGGSGPQVQEVPSTSPGAGPSAGPPSPQPSGPSSPAATTTEEADAGYTAERQPADDAPGEPTEAVATPTPGTSTSPSAVLLLADDFESADPTMGGVWTAFLQTAPGRTPSELVSADDEARSGSRSVRATASPGSHDVGTTCGKASILRKDLDVGIGDTVVYSASFMLDRTDVSVHLIDIEGPGEASGAAAGRGGGGSPGVRLITDRNGRLRLNWKFLNWYENNGRPPPADAPPQPQPGRYVITPGQWFDITLRMTLDDDGQGVTEVWVDGQLDIRVVGTNISPEGLDDLDRYPKLELGANCNAVGGAGPVTVHVDDVRVVREQ